MKKVLIALAISLSLPLLASASTAYFSPATVTLKAGQSVSLNIIVDPQGSQSYTAKVVISYPADIMSVTSWSQASGWLALTQPGYDSLNNVSGSMVKTGGFAGGLESPRVFGTVTFAARSAGTATISIMDTTQVLNAENQNTFSAGARALLTIALPVTPTVNPNPLRPVLKKSPAPAISATTTSATTTEEVATSSATTTGAVAASISSGVSKFPASLVSTVVEVMVIVVAFWLGLFVGKRRQV